MLCVTVLCVTTRSLQTHPPTPTLAEEVPAGVEPVPPQQRKLGTRGTATTTRRSTTNDALVSRLRVVVVVKQSPRHPRKGGRAHRVPVQDDVDIDEAMDVELGSVMTRVAAKATKSSATRSTTTKKTLAPLAVPARGKGQRTTGRVNRSDSVCWGRRKARGE